MKKFQITLLFTVIANLIYAQCPTNGGLEHGNFTNWQAFTGNNNNGANNINLAGFIQGVDPQRHAIQVVPGNFDPLIGSALPVGFDGQFSVRLGNSQVNSEAEILSYTFVVNSSNEQFSFRHAAVMQDAQHLPLDTYPFFQYWISTTNNLPTSLDPNNLILAPQRILFDPSDGIFIPVEGNPTLGYYPWTPRCHDLSGYSGQVVTIFFLNADCSAGGHFGYSYIDYLCMVPDGQPVADFPCSTYACEVENLYFDGTNSQNYDRFEWTIVDLVTGNTASYSGNGRMKRHGYIAGLYKSQYGSMPPGQYEVILRVWNCQLMDEKRCIITITEPIEFSVTNSYGCCTEASGGGALNNLIPSARAVIPSSAPIGTFEWYDTHGNFLGNGTTTQTPSGPNVILDNTFIANNVTSYRKYKVIYKENISGCGYEKWVYAFKIPEFKYIKISNTCVSGECGPRKLEIYRRETPTLCVDPDQYNATWQDLIESVYTYQWNTGATTKSIITTQSITTQDYTCTVTSPCGTYTLSEHVPYDPYNGGFPTFPNLTYTPGVAASTGDFTILDESFINGNPTYTNYYNAYKYYLQIRDQWGGLIYEKTGTTPVCGFPFANYDDIRWNLIGNSGNYNGYNFRTQGTTDTYMFYLQLENCGIPIGGNTELQGDFTIIH